MSCCRKLPSCLLPWLLPHASRLGPLLNARRSLLVATTTQLRLLHAPSPRTRQLLRRACTLPNLLSLSRIACAPIVGYAVVNDQVGLASALIVASAATDWADGWIARRWRQESVLGSWLDPLGDKLFVGVMAGSLLYTGQLPLWLAGLILSRDAGLIVASVVLRLRSLPRSSTLRDFFNPKMSAPAIRPHFTSKINTLLQFLLFSLTVASPLLSGLSPPLGSIVLHALSPLQWIVASTTVASGILYLRDFCKVIRPLLSLKNKA